jgi:hypothetical protein
MWQQTANAIQFFQSEVTFQNMQPNDEVVKSGKGYALAENESNFLLYFPAGLENISLQLPQNNYRIYWFDPKSGGVLQTGSTSETKGGDNAQIGNPPSKLTQDWAVLLRLSE